MVRWYLIFPLSAAICYSSAALFLKAAERRGTSILTLNLVTNGATALAFMLIFFRPEPGTRLAWGPICALGLSFVLGQLFTLLSFAKGEVSVATPALGTKVLMVAILAHATGLQQVRGSTWIAAVLMVIGLVLLVGRPKVEGRRTAIYGVTFALAAAFTFAVFDVLVQRFSPLVGFGNFVPPGLTVAFVLSIPLLRVQRGRPHGVPREARKLLAFGTALIVGQALLFIWSIGNYGDAPNMNVVYASRAVWSVLVVSFLSRWLAEVETFADRGAFGRRLGAAAIMTLGVILVFL